MATSSPPERNAIPGTGARPLRLAVVGMSTSETCGALGHARVLGAELARGGFELEHVWLMRAESALGASRAEVGHWASGELRDALNRGRPDAAVLHYSAFAYGHRGVPLFAHPVLHELRAARVPVLSVMHEYAYRWRARDPRANVWAATQRAALVELVRDSAALLATTDFRVRWLTSRRWLARRPCDYAPVFSNLPAPSPVLAPVRGRLGLFGYSYQGAAASMTLDALATLAAGRQPAPELVLLGAPGPDSPAGALWLEQVRARSLERLVSFSGVLGAQALSDALAACEVLLFADEPGPSSRKGTLAASLGSGRPVVALDGPSRWQELADADVARIVAPSATALADGAAELLQDPTGASALGRRGREFAQQRMSPARAAAVLRNLLAGAVPNAGAA